MRSVSHQSVLCAVLLVSSPVLAQEKPNTEATAAAELESVAEAFYALVPAFPESEWDFETCEYFSRHAERARGLADGLEFAWSLHARDPELVDDLLEFVAVYPSPRDEEKFKRYCLAMDQSLVLLRMMYNESTVFTASGPNGEPAARLSHFGLWIISKRALAGWNAVEPIILFESDIAFWTHRCNESGGEDEQYLNVFYEGQPYLAANEFRALHESATPRYDLPLRVARLRECADWLDEHGPSIWIAPE